MFIGYLLVVQIDWIECNVLGSLLGGIKDTSNGLVGDVTSMFQNRMCQMKTVPIWTNRIKLKTKNNFQKLFDQDELVRHYGFCCERHIVITEDGYKLTVFRVIAKACCSQINKKIVVLEHGIFSSSDEYSMDMPGQGLGTLNLTVAISIN